MKKLSALIAVLFASASLSVFAQAHPRDPAKPTAEAACRSRRPPPPLPSRSPRQGRRADEGRREEGRRKKKPPRRSRQESRCQESRRHEGRRHARPTAPKADAAEGRRHEGRRAESRRAKADRQDRRAEEVIGLPASRKAGLRPRLSLFWARVTNPSSIHENRRRPLRRSRFRRRRAAAEARGPRRGRASS